MSTRARKAYEDTKENSMEMMYVIWYFLCRKCSMSFAHIYYEDVEWKFFIIYILWYCMIGAGNESDKHTWMSRGLVFDNVEKDSDMNKDDDLVSILSQ